MENENVVFQDNESLPAAEIGEAVFADGNPSAEGKSSPLDDNSAAVTVTGTVAGTNGSATEKWPGWPGHCVFRLIVPVTKVGAIIGRKGDFIKKMCEETRARIRVLEGPASTPDRVVLISGKEELEAPLSPAMDAVMRVFRRVSGLPDNDDDVKTAGFVSIRLLVASTQAINLIGKQGSLIKSIQEASAASVRVLSEDETPFYAAEDERMVDIQGEAPKVLKALEAVVGHLRKFLVDHSVVPLFEKNHNARVSQGRQAETVTDRSSLQTSSHSVLDTDFSLLARREPLFFERESRMESRVQPSGVPIYGQDPVLSARRSPAALSRVGAAIVTQVAQTMQIPFSYAEDIIGIEGANIAYIRRASGAAITIQESLHPDEITVEIKGNSSQVQMAQQLIQEFINNHREPVSSGYTRIDAGYVPSYPQLSSRKEPLPGNYGGTETSYRPSYSQLGGSSYPATSLTGQTYGSDYLSSDVGGYSNFKL